MVGEDGTLFHGLTNTSLFTQHLKNMDKLRSARYPHYIGRAQDALNLKAGYCGDLVDASLYIADMIKVYPGETIYTSMICLDTGVFCLDTNDIIKHGLIILHQSNEMNIKDDSYEIGNSIYDLRDIDSLKNAILADPWIYCAHKLKDVDKLLKVAENYSLSKYYKTKSVKFNHHGYKSHISSLANDSDHTNKYQNILGSFYESYEEQKQKLANKRDSFAEGRRYSSVRRSLEYNIHQDQLQIQRRTPLQKLQQREQELTSLRDFFNQINNKSSSWYSRFDHNDDKVARINEAINYLTICIDSGDYPGKDKLINLFQCIFRILPIVILYNSPLGNLSIDTIDMTSTAEGIFSLNVTPIKPYVFEEIIGLNLNWIRDSRNYKDRRRYENLLNKIAGFTPTDPTNDLNDFLRSFYTNKAGYYNLVTLETAPESENESKHWNL